MEKQLQGEITAFDVVIFIFCNLASIDSRMIYSQVDEKVAAFENSDAKVIYEKYTCKGTSLDFVS
jgi:hypothetical protein